MNCLRTITCVAVLCLAFVYVSLGQPLQSRRLRAKRQLADIITTDYQARAQLEKQPNGCLEIGCGLVNLIESGKRKRTFQPDLPEVKQRFIQLLYPSYSELFSDSQNKI